MAIEILNSDVVEYEIEEVTENKEYNVIFKKSSNAGDQIVMPYSYNKGSETNVVLTYYVDKFDLDYTRFPVSDTDSNSSITLSADATKRVAINTSNLDDRFVVNVVWTDGGASNGTLGLGFYEKKR